MSDASKEILGELLAQSLIAWGLDGAVQTTSDGAILLSCNGRNIRVQAAAPNLPFRWMVTVDHHARGAISLVAVLRRLRIALDPNYAANPVHVAFPRTPS